MQIKITHSFNILSNFISSNKTIDDRNKNINKKNKNIFLLRDFNITNKTSLSQINIQVLQQVINNQWPMNNLSSQDMHKASSAYKMLGLIKNINNLNKGKGDEA